MSLYSGCALGGPDAELMTTSFYALWAGGLILLKVRNEQRFLTRCRPKVAWGWLGTKNPRCVPKRRAEMEAAFQAGRLQTKQTKLKNVIP